MIYVGRPPNEEEARAYEPIHTSDSVSVATYEHFGVPVRFFTVAMVPRWARVIPEWFVAAYQAGEGEILPGKAETGQVGVEIVSSAGKPASFRIALGPGILGHLRSAIHSLRDSIHEPVDEKADRALAIVAAYRMGGTKSVDSLL